MVLANGNLEISFILGVGSLINRKEWDILNLGFRNIVVRLKMDISMEKD